MSLGLLLIITALAGATWWWLRDLANRADAEGVTPDPPHLVPDTAGDEPVVPVPPLEVVATFLEPVAADLARSVLAGSGIPASLKDDNLMRMNPLYGIAVDGVKLQVEQQDAARAREILADYGEFEARPLAPE